MLEELVQVRLEPNASVICRSACKADVVGREECEHLVLGCQPVMHSLDTNSIIVTLCSEFKVPDLVFAALHPRSVVVDGCAECPIEI